MSRPPGSPVWFPYLDPRVGLLELPLTYPFRHLTHDLERVINHNNNERYINSYTRVAANVLSSSSFSSLTGRHYLAANLSLPQSTLASVA